MIQNTKASSSDLAEEKSVQFPVQCQQSYFFRRLTGLENDVRCLITKICNNNGHKNFGWKFTGLDETEPTEGSQVDCITGT